MNMLLSATYQNFLVLINICNLNFQVGDDLKLVPGQKDQFEILITKISALMKYAKLEN